MNDLCYWWEVKNRLEWDFKGKNVAKLRWSKLSACRSLAVLLVTIVPECIKQLSCLDRQKAEVVFPQEHNG